MDCLSCADCFKQWHGTRLRGWLELGGTEVSDLAPLSGLVKVQELSLFYTQLSDLRPLYGLTRLRHLYLDGAPVAAPDIMEVQAVLPACRRAALSAVDGKRVRTRSCRSLVKSNVFRNMQMTECRPRSDDTPLKTMGHCPYCSEPFTAGAEHCPHCGRSFAGQLIAMTTHADASVREAAVDNFVFVAASTRP
jgi:hypothetical protein